MDKIVLLNNSSSLPNSPRLNKDVISFQNIANKALVLRRAIALKRRPIPK